MSVESGFVDHQGISGWTLLATCGTRETRAADVLGFHVVLNVRNFLGVVATLRALPTASFISEHQAAHKVVEPFQRLGVRSLQKQDIKSCISKTLNSARI